MTQTAQATPSLSTLVAALTKTGLAGIFDRLHPDALHELHKTGIISYIMKGISFDLFVKADKSASTHIVTASHPLLILCSWQGSLT